LVPAATGSRSSAHCSSHPSWTITGLKFRCTSYPAATKSSMAAMRSLILEVRMSTCRDTSAGISENLTRVPPCGS
jgi:hypothetical protein